MEWVAVYLAIGTASGIMHAMRGTAAQLVLLYSALWPLRFVVVLGQFVISTERAVPTLQEFTDRQNRAPPPNVQGDEELREALAGIDMTTTAYCPSCHQQRKLVEPQGECSVCGQTLRTFTQSQEQAVPAASPADPEGDPSPAAATSSAETSLRTTSRPSPAVETTRGSHFAVPKTYFGGLGRIRATPMTIMAAALVLLAAVVGVLGYFMLPRDLVSRVGPLAVEATAVAETRMSFPRDRALALFDTEIRRTCAGVSPWRMQEALDALDGSMHPRIGYWEVRSGGRQSTIYPDGVVRGTLMQDIATRLCR